MSTSWFVVSMIIALVLGLGAPALAQQVVWYFEDRAFARRVDRTFASALKLDPEEYEAQHGRSRARMFRWR